MALNFRVPRVLQHRLVQNGLALYLIQATTMLFPLVTVPFLARVLGPVMFGTVALAQAAGMYVMTTVEYNFTLSGTRDVARARHLPEELSRILADVILARVMLILISAGIAAVAIYTVPVFAANRVLLMAAGYEIGRASCRERV